MRRWFSKIDPRTMEKSEVRRVLNLPEQNNVSSFIEVQIPAGTKLRVGIVDYGIDGTKGGVGQFDIMELDINLNWITKRGAL